MAKNATVDATRLRRETRTWLSQHTIRDVRTIAGDLENAGEDVHDLREALDGLESLVREESRQPRRSRGKPKA